MSMKDMVIDEIVNNFFKGGLDEFNISYLIYASEKENTDTSHLKEIEDILDHKDDLFLTWEALYGHRINKISFKDFVKEGISEQVLIDSLYKCSDKQLLQILRSQHCQEFR